MAGTQIATSVTILNSLLGYAAVSLTNFATSAETMVAAGSKLEVAGGFFTFSSDEQPSGWVSIGTAATAYIACVPSGTAGSQVLTPEWTEDAPVWRDDLQGWYGSAASSSRYVGTVYKTSATQWDDARVLMALQGTTRSSLALERLEVSGSISGTAGVFTTINTGQGAHELYEMDQDVTTTDNVDFQFVEATRFFGTLHEASVANGATVSFTGLGPSGRAMLLLVGAAGWGTAMYFASAAGTVANAIAIVETAGGAFAATDTGTAVRLYWDGNVLDLKNSTGTARTINVAVLTTQGVFIP